MFTHKKDKLLELLFGAAENLREASAFFQKQSLTSENNFNELFWTDEGS
ncbi:hypothetical protein LRR81_16870 [Metabacillus sp. GX 13764]|nr:hypothetical protein [Metabacillus kandeliae]MCD7035919.1 hypothetical protein [Metabacillus kandeliae]